MSRLLAGDVALVTGAGSGLGRASAAALAEAGARVCAFDLDADTAAHTRTDLEALGSRALAVAGDASRPEDAERAVAETARELGPLTILVNAAGIVVKKGLLDTTPGEWRRVLEVNLGGYFHFLRAAVPAMEAAGGGRIVQIASTAAHVGYGYPAYTAAKGGVLAMTRQLALELGPKGIRINSISPGVVETGLNRDSLADPAVRRQTVEHTPLGRIGEPADVARAVLFLAGPNSDFVTGTDLLVDGGLISGLQWRQRPGGGLRGGGPQRE
jgi:NAD(P)-dependent dehydrogenase (short-subunit alcohol dehydrogenase family)